MVHLLDGQTNDIMIIESKYKKNGDRFSEKVKLLLGSKSDDVGEWEVLLLPGYFINGRSNSRYAGQWK